ncbi:MAG: methyltransferase type 12, partial [Bacteroidetes bacterium]|nr:methyltransferase type 12 [Bacteroidota bacterium]
ENYKVHNIKSMDVNLISNIAKELGLKETNAFYYGKPMVWLEAKHGAMNAIIRKFIKLVNLVLRVLPFGGRLFSPYIALQAKK